MVGEVRGHLNDVAGPADPNAVRADALGRPQSVPARELDDDPALAGVCDEMRVTAVGGRV